MTFCVANSTGKFPFRKFCNLYLFHIKIGQRKPPLPPKVASVRNLNTNLDIPKRSRSNEVPSQRSLPPIPPKPADLTQKMEIEKEIPAKNTVDTSLPLDENANLIDIEYMITAYDHPKGKDEELELMKDEVVCLLERTSTDWYYVTKDGINCGFVASSFLEPYSGEPPEHLQIYAYVCDSQEGGTNNLQERKIDTNHQLYNTIRSISSPRAVSKNAPRPSDNAENSSKITTKIRAGSKFLSKRKKRKSANLSTGRNNASIKRQETTPVLRPDTKSNQRQRRHSDNDGQELLSPPLQRGRILKEILTTERQYNAILETLVNVIFLVSISK